MRIEPVTPERWDDLVTLFGPNGAYANCWCTWWIWRASEWDRHVPDERRDELARRVAAGEQPGLLAYDEHGQPVGWCAVAPRHRYARLTSPRARTFGPLDDRPSWVITCFFVRRDRRGEGVARELLGAVEAFVASHGGELIEGYPVEEAHGAAALYTGTASMFAAAGYVEAARPNGRPLVRLELPRRR